tara:strand:+ start:78 stop:389 length:312 start_codon:yes stop_codon:yes gene_type:complete
MEFFSYFDAIIAFVGRIIEYIGLCIVAGSVFISLYKVLTPKFTIARVRHDLAKRIIFGLEFVIAADILLATVATDFFQIARLGGIVVIRVVLGYALRKEVRVK